MAIQMRRGQLVNYDKSKMLAGEWGISIDQDTNDQKAFIAFAPGVDKEVLFVEDAEEQIAIATAAAIADATEEAKGWARGDSFHVSDYASGDGSTTAFTLTYTPTSIIAVYVDGAETSAYTQSGTTITFTTAPAAGLNNIRVHYTVSTATDNAKYYKEQAANSASSASGSASSASTNALKSEGYAVGKQNGTDVGSGSEYYHNNAKYYKDEAGSSATAAADGEAWAVGTRGGTPVPSTDPQYQNNSKFWAEQAAASAAMLDAEKILGDFAHYENTTTASQPYAVGDFLTLNGYLYRVTTAISSGGTIVTSGGSANVVQTTVGDEIKGGKIWKQAQAIASTGGSSGTLCTITDPLITANHVLDKFVPADSNVIISGVTCTPYDGYVVITGTSTNTTTAEILLIKPDKIL